MPANDTLAPAQILSESIRSQVSCILPYQGCKIGAAVLI